MGVSERDRLHDLYGRALERLATDRAGQDDLRGALECWRRLAAADPLNSRVACRVAETLDGSGDRAGRPPAPPGARRHAEGRTRHRAAGRCRHAAAALRAAPLRPAPSQAPEAPTAPVPEPIRAAEPVSPPSAFASSQAPRSPRRAGARVERARGAPPSGRAEASAAAPAAWTRGAASRSGEPAPSSPASNSLDRALRREAPDACGGDARPASGVRSCWRHSPSSASS